MPPLTGAVAWLNSPPLTPESLRGEVVLVDFWTYSCINCLRTLPYVRAWASKYKDHGLVVSGVHAPEFAFEKNVDNVRRAIKDLRIWSGDQQPLPEFGGAKQRAEALGDPLMQNGFEQAMYTE
jgi:thiol-disulfide isomerase/thioredoxin